jgi:hypothetical protein
MGIQNDTLTLQFINPVTNFTDQTLSFNFANYNQGSSSENIDNSTSVNFEKDFYTPSNGLTICIADNRVNQLIKFMQRGYKVSLLINNKPNMIGYIFDYDLTYSRNGGTQLIIKCKDLLEYMAQGSVYPNMGTGSDTNFHFKPTDSLLTAMSTIVNAFKWITGESGHIGQILINPNPESDGLTFASGFDFGVRVKGKTPKSRQKSFNDKLNHLTTPMKGESYLAYMLRLAKMAGCNIKMSNVKDNVINVIPPIYDRVQPSPFKLYHYLSAPNNSANNVLDARYCFGLDHQPSVVIIESATGSNGDFYQKALKGVAVNELTGYTLSESQFPPTQLLGVQEAISQLTTGELGTGYDLAPFNTDLYNANNAIPVNILTQVSLPYYNASFNAHTQQEASFAASMILAEQQDKYVEMIYRVKGWTMTGTNVVWQPNTMVQITEEIFSPGNPKVFNMWIRKVNYKKNRNDGTITELVCTLPYTHNFEITE